MKITTVKEEITDGVLTGYKVNGDTFFSKENCELIKQWIAEGNTPEPEFSDEEIQKQELQIKINEAKQYLASTDHKFYNGYKPKEGEDLVEIERLRDKDREFLRANEI